MMNFKTFFLCLLVSFPFTGEGKKNRIFEKAKRRASVGRHIEATQSFFSLLKKPYLKSQRNAIRYHLALSLYEMKLYHPAIAQFQYLIKNKAKGYRRGSLKKIALSATSLRSDRLLHYALSQGSLKYLSSREKQDLYYHFGEYWMRRKKFRQAIAQFSRVKSTSPFFHKALYQLGLAHAEMGRANRAIQIFHQLEHRRSGVTDNVRVAAVMGKARAYYQAKKWDRSIEHYQKVPKDSPFWHDTLLERSWALLRSGRFRSTLSNFHTLHSAYYENHYQPESLLLRAIVYLYICKYYEMEKVLELFGKIYRPVYNRAARLLRTPHSLKSYYNALNSPSENGLIQYPPVVLRRIRREGGFATHHHYVNQLQKEQNLIYDLPYGWRNSSVGRYSSALVQKRLDKAQRKAGRLIIGHLKSIRKELKDFFSQEQFIRYEMLRSRRFFLKKKIAGREQTGTTVEDFGRSFYIQNGYEYWPFQGEYWLDELGNYHYVGMESCKK